MPMTSLLLATALAAGAVAPGPAAPTFGFVSAFPAVVEDAALREAAAIWSEHHVVVDGALPCASEPDEVIVLKGQPAYAPVPPRNVAIALGALAFAGDGSPLSLVTVYFDRLRRAIAHERLGDVA